MPRATQYEVTIPQGARMAFGGLDRLRRRFHDQKAAAVWSAQIRQQIAQALAGAELESVGIVKQPDPPTLAAASRAWLESRPVRQTTIRYYRERLVQLLALLGAAPVTDVGPATWEAYAARRRQDGASDGTLARDLQVLQSILRWAQGMGWPILPGIWRVPRPKSVPLVQRRYDPEAVARVLDLLDPRDRAALEVLAGTGMRAGELRAFRVEWIRWAEGRIEIPHSQAYSPKGARPRSLPLTSHLAQVLTDWLDGRTQGLVFPPLSRSGPRRQGLGTRRLLERLRAAGLDVASLHDLRHHYLSTLAHRGLPGRIVQELAGHSSIRTTDRYLHAAPGYLDQARQALEGPLPSQFPSSPSEGRRRKGLKR